MLTADIFWIVISLLIVALGLVLDSKMLVWERFTTTDTRDADVDKYISKVYLEILDRYPSDVELKEHRRAVLSGKRSFNDIRQRLIDSPEYNNMTKMQSNKPSPELMKMISDSKLLRRLADIYKEERKKTIPPKLVLPLKTIFIKLGYNEPALRYMLRSEKWAELQEDILADDNLSEKSLQSLIDKTYGGFDKIIEDSEKESDEPSPANINEKIDRMIEDEDSDMSALLDDINNKGYEVFDKDVAAMCTCGGAPGSGDCLVHKQIPVRPHYGNMVLRPEFAWSVPQQRPPVCTTLGKPSLVQPVYMSSSKDLIGTDLSDAQDTSVGWIMPKFTYKEYVDVNVKDKSCTSSTSTSKKKDAK